MCSGYISTPGESEQRRQEDERIIEFLRIVNRLRESGGTLTLTLDEMLLLGEYAKPGGGLKGPIPTKKEVEILRAAERRIFHEQAI